MHSRSLAVACSAFALLTSSVVHAKSKADADAKEVENYKLSVPVLKKLEQVQENLSAAVKSNPSLAKKYEKNEAGSANESLDETARKMDRIPELKAAVSKAGLTTREYLVAAMALFQAAMADQLSNMQGADVGSLPAGVRANAAFVKSHKAEVDRMTKRMKELDAESKKGSGGKQNEGKADDESPPPDEEQK
jgi:hypothetical protein